ncbi:MAG TPA: GrpB family protein [Caulobacteraceae bacterium]|nr:GrpB family protein [Caulobacteraceae bacterium]
MSASIEIVEPRAGWAAEFGAIAERLADVFGGLALRIEHIGSTSVAGLAAKDVIDVQVTVASLDLPGIGETLTAAGFPPRDGLWGAEGYWEDHRPAGASERPDDWVKRYARGAPGQRRSHIHIRRAGAENERYARLFRDYLRANPPAAATYGEIKRELAARHADDVDAYYAVKDPVCDLIIQAAELWAVATGWDRR